MYNDNVNGVLLLSKDFETKEEALAAIKDRFFKKDDVSFNNFLKRRKNLNYRDYENGIDPSSDFPYVKYDINIKQETDINSDIITKLEKIGSVSKINDYYLLEIDKDCYKEDFFDIVAELKNNLKFDNVIDEYFKTYKKLVKFDLLLYSLHKHYDDKIYNTYIDLRVNIDMLNKYVLISKAFLYDCKYESVCCGRGERLYSNDYCRLFKVVKYNSLSKVSLYDGKSDDMYYFLKRLSKKQELYHMRIDLKDLVEDDDFQCSNKDFVKIGNMFGHILSKYNDVVVFMPDIDKLKKIISDEVNRMKDELDLFITKKDFLCDRFIPETFTLDSIMLLDSVMRKSSLRFNGHSLYEFALNLYNEVLQGKRTFYTLSLGIKVHDVDFPVSEWFR